MRYYSNPSEIEILQFAKHLVMKFLLNKWCILKKYLCLVIACLILKTFNKGVFLLSEKKHHCPGQFKKGKNNTDIKIVMFQLIKTFCIKYENRENECRKIYCLRVIFKAWCSIAVEYLCLLNYFLFVCSELKSNLRLKHIFFLIWCHFIPYNE